MTFDEAVKAGKVTQDTAMAIYDTLAPVDIDFMIGRWMGSEFFTGHPIDGELTKYGWYGKQYKSAEDGDPLLFNTLDGKGIFAADPIKVIQGDKLMDDLLEHQAEVETTRPTCRLRMIEYRGKSTATMVYDDIPSLDYFRKVDDNTVLGAMDTRGEPRTFFFVLRRTR